MIKKLLLLLSLVGYLYTPQVLAQIGTGHTATVTWVDITNPPVPITTYNVYRASGICGTTGLVFTKLAGAVTALTYTDATITLGNNCYQVTASVNNVESAPAAGQAPVLAPAPVTSVTVTVK